MSRASANGLRTEPLAPPVVVAAFATQARRSPDAVALQWNGQQLTYGELDRRTSALAGRLRLAGAGPDTVVALATDRSFDLVIGVLGILKAGAAYLPVDPAHPPARIACVLEDSRAALVVTQRALRESLPAATVPTILIDAAAALSSGAPPDPGPLPEPGHLAYVIYTSGSTGLPKGVAISHRALAHFLRAMRHEPGITAGDSVLAITTVAFDIAALELLLPLTVGARVVLAPRDVATSGPALMRALADYQVTMLQATPASWRMLLAADWPGSPGLKALCGGEPMSPALAEKLRPRCAELWNMYGPTETTIWSTCARVTDARDVHVGRPIGNTTILVVGADGEPVPAGDEGEIWIGGDGVAQGYLYRPELTAARFVSRPNEPETRWYRTGDRGRLRRDGNLECLGRIDHQVKIRGHRVELGEIEAQLSSHPHVTCAAVVAQPASDDELRLVAYLTAATAPAPGPGELRTFLGRLLPASMVPVAYVPLPAMPLTPNGKVDRQALPVPEARHFISGRTAVSPRSAIESALLALFSRVLQQPIDSVEDGFFDLGGSSLQAARLVAAIEQEFGQRLPLALLLQASTIAGLAKHLAASPAALKCGALVPIVDRPGRPVLFLVHGAGGNLLLYRELAAALGPDVSVFGFQVTAESPDRPTTIEAMAAHYRRELRTQQPAGPYRIAGYCMGGTVALELARQLRAAGEVVDVLALLDTYNFHVARPGHDQTSWTERWGQKVRFHAANLVGLSWRNLPAYLTEKCRLMREAASNWVAAARRARTARRHGRSSARWRNFHVTTINERAAWDYVPGTYEGPLTVFAPRVNYGFYTEPDLGWTRVAGPHVRVERLPVNPHAMLVGPGAVILAQELKRLIRTVTAAHHSRMERFPPISSGSANPETNAADGHNASPFHLSQPVPSVPAPRHNHLVPTGIQLPH